MAAKSEAGRQSDRTLAECMLRMLDDEIATDVCFKVGPPDEEPVNIKAHKAQLIARSVVFETMFSSGMTECSGPEAIIRVKDIDAKIFKDFLRYVYCETIAVTVETAADLMYAAKQYELPGLVKECEKCISDGLNVNNVVYVLGRSFLFKDKELQNQCFKLIGPNANTILTGKEILSASQEIMETIIQMDTLLVNEIVVYESCIRWAQQQLQIKESTEIPETTENPTDQQIRTTLGPLLYKIRFPLMDLDEFIKISQHKDILTENEKLSIHYFLKTKEKSEDFRFQIERRFGNEILLERTITNPSDEWHSRKIIDAINFTTDKDIFLTGIGLYVGHKSEGYDVDLEILQSTNSLLKMKVTVPSTLPGNLTHFKVSLNKPIFIRAAILYSIKASSIYFLYGCSSQTVFTKENTKFIFSENSESILKYDKFAQFPRFYFCNY